MAFCRPGVESASISASGKMYTFGGSARLWNISEPHTNGGTGTNDPVISAPIFGEASIGVFSAENRNVRRERQTIRWVGGHCVELEIAAGSFLKWKAN
jgi:hypothetical protein